MESYFGDSDEMFPVYEEILIKYDVNTKYSDMYNSIMQDIQNKKIKIERRIENYDDNTFMAKTVKGDISILFNYNSCKLVINPDCINKKYEYVSFVDYIKKYKPIINIIIDNIIYYRVLVSNIKIRKTIFKQENIRGYIERMYMPNRKLDRISKFSLKFNKTEKIDNLLFDNTITIASGSLTNTTEKISRIGTVIIRDINGDLNYRIIKSNQIRKVLSFLEKVFDYKRIEEL